MSKIFLLVCATIYGVLLVTVYLLLHRPAPLCGHARVLVDVNRGLWTGECIPQLCIRQPYNSHLRINIKPI